MPRFLSAGVTEIPVRDQEAAPRSPEAHTRRTIGTHCQVHYWLKQRRKRMTSDDLAKGSVVWDSLTRGRTDGAMARFVTLIGGDETEADAEARMRCLMADVLPQLPRFIPE